MPYCVEDLYYPANDTERSKLNWSPFEVLTVLKVSCCVKVNPFSASSLLLRRWKLISIHCESRWDFITYLRYSVLGKGSFSWPIFIIHREKVCSGIRRRWWMMFWMWTIHVYAFQESNVLGQRLPCVAHKREPARKLRETVSWSPVPMNLIWHEIMVTVCYEVVDLLFFSFTSEDNSQWFVHLHLRTICDF